MFYARLTPCYDFYLTTLVNFHGAFIKKKRQLMSANRGYDCEESLLLARRVIKRRRMYTVKMKPEM